MKIYPVRFWNNAENARMKHVKVKPFTSQVEAMNFLKDLNQREEIVAEMLDTEDYSLNKAGILKAFNEGQSMLLESDFVQSR